MGRDKAELEYDGRSLVARTFELLSGFCAQVWVSCRPDQADSPSRRGFPQIHDKLFDRGPLGGLLSALEYRPEAAWLVLACDQPYLTEATVTELLAGRDPRAFATAFVGLDGLPEPLCAVYEPKSRLRLLQTWALGYPCPRKLLAGPGAVLLQPSRPETLTDVNTPRDDQRARAALGSM
jgi:molybdopterin-guanine dinucleotide biosynthesis protein A